MDADNSGKMDFEMNSVKLENVPVAYVRPIKTPHGLSYAVCSAEGLQLAMFATEDAAYFTAKQHDLEPVLVH